MAGRSFDFVDVVVLDQGRLVGLVGASRLLEAGEASFSATWWSRMPSRRSQGVGGAASEAKGPTEKAGLCGEGLVGHVHEPRLGGPTL